MGRIQGKGVPERGPMVSEKRRQAALIFRPVIAVATVAALGVALACCQQVLSIEGNVTVQPTGSACGITMPTGACEECVASQCCEQASACAGDPACLALESCLLGCGSDYACRATCTKVDQIGSQTDVPTLDACVAASCNQSCGMICGQAGSYTAPDAAQACQQCVEAKSCAQTLACTSSVACEVLGHCAYSCTTPDCRAACADDAGDVDEFVNTALGVGIPCYGPCQVGHDWTCVGSVAWPTSHSTEQDVTVTVDGLNGASPAGVSVQVCKQGDDSCATPFSKGTSNASGAVSLSLPAPSGFFGFQGSFELSSASVASTLFDLSFPLSAQHAQLTVFVLSQTGFLQTLAGVNITPNPARGHVWVIALDCLQLFAPDVTVVAEGLGSDPEVREMYYASGAPSPTARATDASGMAFFYNVPPGPLQLHVIPNDTGAVSSTVRVFVQAGMISEVAALPTALGQ